LNFKIRILKSKMVKAVESFHFFGRLLERRIFDESEHEP